MLTFCVLPALHSFCLISYSASHSYVDPRDGSNDNGANGDGWEKSGKMAMLEILPAFLIIISCLALLSPLFCLLNADPYFT